VAKTKKLSAKRRALVGGKAPAKTAQLSAATARKTTTGKAKKKRRYKPGSK